MAAVIATGFLFTSTASANAMSEIKDLEDGSSVSISGTIKEVRPNEFNLDYGSGTIPVEFQGWYWEGTSSNYLTNYFKPGDMVKVSGKIDDGFFSGKEIEALTVVKFDETSFNVEVNDYLNKYIYEYTPGKMSMVRAEN